MADQSDSQQDVLDDLQPPKRLRTVPGAQKSPEAGQAQGEAEAGADPGSSDAQGVQGEGSPTGRDASAKTSEGQTAQAETGGGGSASTQPKSGASRDAANSPAAAQKSEGESEPAAQKSPSEESEESASGDEKPTEGPKRTPAKSGPLPGSFRMWRNIAIAIVALLVVLLVLFGAFTWNRWHRFDDAADLQGEWYAAGTSVPVSIDATAIHFNEKTAYEYTVDDELKTIRFTLGNMEGSGHYWFSADREYLVIFDGDDFTKWGTAFDDMGRDVGNWFNSLFGNDLVLPSGDGIIALSRTPNSGGTTPLPAADDSSESSDSSAAESSSEAAQKPQDGEASDSAAPSSDAASSSSSTKGIFAEVADQAYKDPDESDAEGEDQDADYDEAYVQYGEYEEADVYADEGSE